MTRVIAHEPGCPALCQLISCVHFHNLPHTKECGFGKNCPLGHACACHAGEQLRKLEKALREWIHNPRDRFGDMVLIKAAKDFMGEP